PGIAFPRNGVRPPSRQEWNLIGAAQAATFAATPPDQVPVANRAPSGVWLASFNALLNAGKTERRSEVGPWQAALLRDIFGNPFRPVAIDRTIHRPDGTVALFAEAVYDDRTFDRLPILADALEEAGCTDAAILEHCRGPGPHVRGCWVVDLV